MKNWEGHTEKLLNWYADAIKRNPLGDGAKEARAQIIEMGKLLDDTEKTLYNAAQEIHPPV